MKKQSFYGKTNPPSSLSVYALLEPMGVVN